MNRMIARGVLALSGLVIAPSIAGAQNLLLNDSFEAPAFPGPAAIYSSPSGAITSWSISGPGDMVVHHSPVIGAALGNPTFDFAHHGDFYLDLSGSGAPHATISQSFATSVGQPYQLSFWIGASNDTAPAATIHVQVDGALTLLATALTPAPPMVNINWTLQSFLFTADSTMTTLSFQGLSGTDDNASFVDSCSVVAVPAPAALPLLGAAAVFAGRRRRV